MIVPFLLSLRQTDYAGHVAVIGYDLSREKIAILQSQGVDVFVAGASPLAVGRFIEVAEICRANPRIEKIALYDADIWFPGRTFDLFESVVGDALFACVDPLMCGFVAKPLIGPRREENRRLVIDGILSTYGGALQAGLLAGTRQAWLEFGDHIRDGLSRLGTDFTLAFGLDTTLLHLWAARGRVARLSQTQNFIVKSGLIEIYDYATYETSFASVDGPIRGLHMGGDVRFVNRWRYFTNRPDHALDAGRAFALSSPEALPPAPVPDEAVRTLREFGLDVASADTEANGYVHAFAHDESVHLHVSGNHAIALRAAQAFPEIHVYLTHTSGFPSPITMAVEVDGAAYPSSTLLLDHYTFRHLAEGKTVTLRATSLAGQMCGATWILARRPAIRQ